MAEITRDDDRCCDGAGWLLTVRGRRSGKGGRAEEAKRQNKTEARGCCVCTCECVCMRVCKVCLYECVHVCTCV